MFIFTPQVPKMIKNEENHDFVRFIGVTMATWEIRQEFQTSFLTIMFCLYSVSKNSKIIQTFIFSEIVRPKMGLIDPSPLCFIMRDALEILR